MEKCKELIDELVERLEELDVPQHVLEMAKGLQGEISELYSGSEEDDKDLEEHSPEEIKGMPLPEMEEKMEKSGKYTRSPKTGLMVAIALHPKNKE